MRSGIAILILVVIAWLVPPDIPVQSQPGAAPRETFDLATIKPADTVERGTMIQFAPGGRLVA